MQESSGKNDNVSRASFNSTLRAWNDFMMLAERFDRQRAASDSGLAFSFTEGVLVDAIRSGKW